MTEEAKKRFDVPIILIGYVTPELGEQMLEEGKADFIGMNRPLICDPELPNKLKAGHPEDIAPCTRCGTCLDQSESFLRHCRINASVGFGRYGFPKADKKKKVVVVGGGPSGMEAARVAALRGHDVTLLEKSSRLGGLVPLAALIKGTELEDLPSLIDYLKTQLTKTGVKVRLKTEASVHSLQEMKPDAVILATGGVLTSPKLEGGKKAKGKVVTTPAAAQAGQALPEPVRPQVPRPGDPLLPAHGQEGGRGRGGAARHGGGGVPGQAGPHGHHRGAHARSSARA